MPILVKRIDPLLRIRKKLGSLYSLKVRRQRAFAIIEEECPALNKEAPFPLEREGKRYMTLSLKVFAMQSKSERQIDIPVRPGARVRHLQQSCLEEEEICALASHGLEKGKDKSSCDTL